jgi:hypothetical protein
VYRRDTAGVEEYSFGGGSFSTVDMCLTRQLESPMVYDLTAMPMFRTRESRLACSGSRFSMIVSCDTSSACSSLIHQLRYGRLCTTHIDAAAVVELLCLLSTLHLDTLDHF